MKYLFITKRNLHLKVHNNSLYVGSLSKIPLHKLGGILTFYNTPVIEDIKNVPIAIVEKEIILKNVLQYNNENSNISYYFLLDIEKFCIKFYKKLIDSQAYNDYRMFTAWFFFERRLTNTFLASSALLFLKDIHFNVNPYKEVNVLGFNYQLWNTVILPAVCYGIFKELNDRFTSDTEKAIDRKSCINTALSYIIGNPTFKSILSRSLNIAFRYGICKPHHPKSHGSFPSNTGKL